LKTTTDTAKPSEAALADTLSALQAQVQLLALASRNAKLNVWKSGPHRRPIVRGAN
jgi:hypothetical protein